MVSEYPNLEDIQSQERAQQQAGMDQKVQQAKQLADPKVIVSAIQTLAEFTQLLETSDPQKAAPVKQALGQLMTALKNVLQAPAPAPQAPAPQTPAPMQPPMPAPQTPAPQAPAPQAPQAPAPSPKPSEPAPVKRPIGRTMNDKKGARPAGMTKSSRRATPGAAVA